MNEARRRAYLEALGFDVWVARSAAPAGGAQPAASFDAPFDAPADNQHGRIQVGSGRGSSLLVCSSAADSASKFAADVVRALGGDPAWAWPVSGMVRGAGGDHATLEAAIGARLITHVLVFGDDTVRWLFQGAIPPVVGSATVTPLAGLGEISDEIITDLSRVRALRVISRSSAMRLKGGGRSLAEISRELACRYVLEGSVRRAANSLRITTRLVVAPNDVQLWADKYGGTLDDVFDIQERVSLSIVDALEIRLTPQEAAQLAERPIADVRAQECYLRARSEIWSFLPGGLDRAIGHLEAALRLVGDNALVYQGLGEAYFQHVNIGVAGGREEEFIRKAEWCADRIFALERESQHHSRS